MAIIQDIQEPGIGGYELRNITHSNPSAQRGPMYMNRRRDTIYSSTGSTMYYSQNDGASWTAVTGTSFTGNVSGMVELDDGEVLVCAQDASSSPSRVYKSTGWNGATGASSWGLVLTTTGGYIQPNWGMHNGCFGKNGFGVISEYGAQTSAAGDQTAKGRRVYKTTDFGATWSAPILDIYTYPDGLQAWTGVHVHGCAYDEEWDRIWVTFGDGTGQGDDIVTEGWAQILYSDDRGTTWQKLRMPPFWGGGAFRVTFQFTAIYTSSKAVVFNCDGHPYGLVIYPKIGYRQLDTAKMGPLYHPGTGGTAPIGMYFRQAWGSERAPVFAAMTTFYDSSTPLMVYMSPDGGLSWSEVWRSDIYETGFTNNNGDCMYVVGPTTSGKLLGRCGYTAGGTRANGTWLSADIVPV